jgi:glyoxylase-like metal-dependent hydrolase (beta-lactamase superfamily II)
MDLPDDIQCLVAPNPSALTERGTNCWLIGRRAITVVDPGPDDDHHLATLQGAIAGRPVERILVTHRHADHAALAPRLAALTGAPVAALPWPKRLTDSTVLADLAVAEPLADGAALDLDGTTWRVLAIPGHLPDHMALWRGDVALTGDTLMGWASTVIAPPTGDLTAYLASLRRLRTIGLRLALPGHGAIVKDPDRRIDWLLAHRAARSAAILSVLGAGPATVATLVRAVYPDLAPALHGAAAATVTAHLIALGQIGEVQPTADQYWHLTG